MLSLLALLLCMALADGSWLQDSCGAKVHNASKSEIRNLTTTFGKS